jgi:hypothetical protein
MNRLFYLSICVLWACSGANKAEHEQTALTMFPNMATVTEDSCARWGKPLTSFTIEYPSRYAPVYNVRDNYVDLSYKDSTGNVIQHIALGKSQHIIGKEEIEKWTHLMDSVMHVSPAYNRDTIGYANYGNREYYILRGRLNYDFLSAPGIKGMYNMTSFMVSPFGTERTNGVLWAVVTKEGFDNEELRKEAQDILNTLRFNE